MIAAAAAREHSLAGHSLGRARRRASLSECRSDSEHWHRPGRDQWFDSDSESESWPGGVTPPD